jgi:hypothetical protein
MSNFVNFHYAISLA